VIDRRTIRRWTDRLAPKLASSYRGYRDRHTKRYEHSTTTPWGFQLHGDLGLAESRSSSNEAEAFLAMVDDCDHVIDVGANVGLFTLMAATRNVPVTAIEPSPMNLAVLYRNLRLNSIDVEVLPVALANRFGLADLYGGGQGASLRSGWGGMASTYTTTVPVHSLDSLFAARLAGQRVVVKIDTEGSELAILRGAPMLLAASPAPSWIVEIGLTENFDGINPDFLAIFDLFRSAGYVARCVEEPGREVSAADVSEWVERGDRGFWNINYTFTRPRAIA
jgi:FkbM family methyltransferase